MLHRKRPPPAQRWREEEEQRRERFPPPPTRSTPGRMSEALAKRRVGHDEYVTITIRRSLWEQFLSESTMQNETTATTAIDNNNSQPTAAPVPNQFGAGNLPPDLEAEVVAGVRTAMADLDARVEAVVEAELLAQELEEGPSRGSLRELWDDLSPMERNCAIGVGALAVGGLLYLALRK